MRVVRRSTPNSPASRKFLGGLRGWGAGLSVAAIAVTQVACSTPPDSHPNPLARVCADTSRYLEAAADPLREGDHNSFGELPDLLNSQSLYYTSWGLRLSQDAGSRPAIIDSTETKEWLTRQFEAAQSQASGLESTEVESIRQTIAGLRVLDADYAPRKDPVAHLAVDWGYAPNRGEQPNLSATFMAIDVLHELGMQPPAATSTFFKAEAKKLSPTADAQAITNHEILVAGALAKVLSRSELHQVVPQLGTMISQWRATLTARESTGVDLVSLLQLHEIAKAADLPWGPLDPETGKNLRTPGGLWSVSTGGKGDPQVTQTALSLGLIDKKDLFDALPAGATPRGWLAPLAKPTLAAAFSALAASRLCNIAVTVPTNFEVWLEEATAAPVTDLRGAYQLCKMAQWFDSSGEHRNKIFALGERSQIMFDTQKQGTDVLQTTYALLAAKACRVEIDVTGATLPEVSARPNAAEAYAHAFLASEYRMNVPEQITSFYESTSENGNFKFAEGSPRPDVASTALAHAAGISKIRQANVETFQSGSAWSQTPAATQLEARANLSTFAWLTSIASPDHDVSPLMIGG